METNSSPYPGSVFVRAYERFRFGRIEHVTQHWRSYPVQLTLFV